MSLPTTALRASSPWRKSRTGFVRRALVATVVVVAAGCASSASFRNGKQAERERNYDRAVIEYTRALQDRPHDRDAQLGLDRAKLRAAQTHYADGRRLAGLSRWEDALAEYQIAYDLNPTAGDIERELRETRNRVRMKLAAREEGQTELEALIDRTRDAAPPGLDIPRGIALPDSVVFREASARAVFSSLGQFGDVNVVFDPAFRDALISIDLRDTTFDTAVASVAASTRNFFRVTAPRTVTIIPDTPAKRREYEEEIVRTFYLSNADVAETIDLLRLVIDLRRLAPVTATNSISIKDTPERIEAAARLLKAIDKARAEVIIEVQLLEADRQTLREYGLQFATPGSPGINSELGIINDGLTLDDVWRLSGADVFVANLPSLFVRLLESHSNTRILANPHLRTSDGVTAEARFGERVPVPVTTFTPIAAGGISQQPITSFNYENIGVNIEITPRIHHNDEVSLSLGVEISNISGTGFGDLPQFGNRAITTTIRLRDGETNILAGLIRDDERETLEGIPGLSSVPVLGRLFGRNKTETQETDIVLTLTPHIIRVLDLDETDLLPFRVGPGRRLVRGGRSRPAATATPGAAAAAAPRAGAGHATRHPGAGDPADPAWSLVHLDPRPERTQAFHEVGVPALDRFKRADPALSIRRERRGDEGHPRSQVARVEMASFQSARAIDDHAVGIAQEEVRAHPAELFEREQSQLVHPVVYQRPALGLRREHAHEAHHVAREPRPRRRGNLPDAPRRRRGNAQPRVIHPTVERHPLQHRRDRLQVSAARPAHLDHAAGDRGDDSPAPGLDVVPLEPVRHPGERRATSHSNRGGPGALDVDPHAPQAGAQLDHVRLGSGVADLGHTIRGGRR